MLSSEATVILLSAIADLYQASGRIAAALTETKAYFKPVDPSDSQVRVKPFAPDTKLHKHGSALSSSSLSSGSGLASQTAEESKRPCEWVFDPAYLVFEYMRNISLRDAQVSCVDNFLLTRDDKTTVPSGLALKSPLYTNPRNAKSSSCSHVNSLMSSAGEIQNSMSDSATTSTDLSTSLIVDRGVNPRWAAKCPIVFPPALAAAALSLSSSTPRSQIRQLIMGQGKTTIISPLLAIRLSDGARLCVVMTPPALLPHTREVLRVAFGNILGKRTVAFDCSRREVMRPETLRKLEIARVARSVVITTPSDVKSLMLKLIDIAVQLVEYLRNQEIAVIVATGQMPSLATGSFGHLGVQVASDKYAHVATALQHATTRKRSGAAETQTAQSQMQPQLHAPLAQRGLRTVSTGLRDIEEHGEYSPSTINSAAAETGSVVRPMHEEEEEDGVVATGECLSPGHFSSTSAPHATGFGTGSTPNNYTTLTQAGTYSNMAPYASNADSEGVAAIANTAAAVVNASTATTDPTDATSRAPSPRTVARSAAATLAAAAAAAKWRKRGGETVAADDDGIEVVTSVVNPNYTFDNLDTNVKVDTAATPKKPEREVVVQTTEITSPGWKNVFPPLPRSLEPLYTEATTIARVLSLFKHSTLIMDEVDLLLHPLKSELNFPLGSANAIEAAPHRWSLPAHLIDAVFFTSVGRLPLSFRQSSRAAAVQTAIKAEAEAGVKQMVLQSSPHLVLLDVAYYHAKLKPLFVEWLILYLERAGIPLDLFSVNDMTALFMQGCKFARSECAYTCVHSFSGFSSVVADSIDAASTVAPVSSAVGVASAPQQQTEQLQRLQQQNTVQQQLHRPTYLRAHTVPTASGPVSPQPETRTASVAASDGESGHSPRSENAAVSDVSMTSDRDNNDNENNNDANNAIAGVAANVCESEDSESRTRPSTESSDSSVSTDAEQQRQLDHGGGLCAVCSVVLTQLRCRNLAPQTSHANNGANGGSKSTGNSNESCGKNPSACLSRRLNLTAHRLALVPFKYRTLLRLGFDWLNQYLPHVLQKINRITYGLITSNNTNANMFSTNTYPTSNNGNANSQGAAVDRLPLATASRLALAVPFIGKDVPSRSSEFSHPDITIGLTLLAYRYDGLRGSDLVKLITGLQSAVATEAGPPDARLSASLYSAWVADAGGRVMTKSRSIAEKSSCIVKASRECPRVHPDECGACSSAGSDTASSCSAAVSRTTNVTASHDEIDVNAEVSADEELESYCNDSGFSSTNEETNVGARSCIADQVRSLATPTVLPLRLLKPTHTSQMTTLFALLRRYPEAITHYLETFVFPRHLPYSGSKIASSGQDLGSEMLFDARIGYSGTPSMLIPREMGACYYQTGQTANTIATLTSPDSADVDILPSNWTALSILARVAKTSRYHALIDTGALITGLNNQQAAEALLALGLARFDGVVFFSQADVPMVLHRKHARVVPFAQCGLLPHRRFTFYDQVHTTGADIMHPLGAAAVQTLGKDMTFRDLAQGAYRMRGLGKGQRVCLYVIPEVQALIMRQIEACVLSKLVKNEAQTIGPESTLMSTSAAALVPLSGSDAKCDCVCALAPLANHYAKCFFSSSSGFNKTKPVGADPHVNVDKSSAAPSGTPVKCPHAREHTQLCLLAILAWSFLNLLESEVLQFRQLCLQSIAGIYRKSAFGIVQRFVAKAFSSRRGGQGNGRAGKDETHSPDLQINKSGASDIRAAVPASTAPSTDRPPGAVASYTRKHTYTTVVPPSTALAATHAGSTITNMSDDSSEDDCPSLSTVSKALALLCDPVSYQVDTEFTIMPPLPAGMQEHLSLAASVLSEQDQEQITALLTVLRAVTLRALSADGSSDSSPSADTATNASAVESLAPPQAGRVPGSDSVEAIVTDAAPTEAESSDTGVFAGTAPDEDATLALRRAIATAVSAATAPYTLLAPKVIRAATAAYSPVVSTNTGAADTNDGQPPRSDAVGAYTGPDFASLALSLEAVQVRVS